jgi:cbb3-type cytochrome oxidase subunit 1
VNAFADTVAAKLPMYVVRGLGGTMFLVGGLIMALQPVGMTVRETARKRRGQRQQLRLQRNKGSRMQNGNS